MGKAEDEVAWSKAGQVAVLVLFRAAGTHATFLEAARINQAVDPLTQGHAPLGVMAGNGFRTAMLLGHFTALMDFRDFLVPVFRTHGSVNSYVIQLRACYSANGFRYHIPSTWRVNYFSGTRINIESSR